MVRLIHYERDAMTATATRRQARLLQRQQQARRLQTATLLALCMLPVAAVFAAPSVFPTGVTRYEPQKAWNGYVLFPGQDKKTHLIDMNGNEVHQWAQEGFPPVLVEPGKVGGARGHVLLQLARLPGAYGGADTTTRAAPGGAAKQHRDWERLANGNTLVLANLVHESKGFKAPQVLDDVPYEVDPQGKIVWEYTAVDSRQTQWSFYSAFISSARRLPNGNTLVDEGMNGRVFHVTPQGEIVWEYVSPFYGDSLVGGSGRTVRTNWVYRAQPVPYDWAPDGTPRSERPLDTVASTR
jgi:hypothetical protein